ncbi:MAG: leucine-rich repeat domain-containing protein, partial [Eubacterium sp.]|nr:leucine-rich repeat domain-containing protein [Eubacterium sp.]
IIFRDNLKELFSKMDFNYSVDVPVSDSGFAGKGNEIVSVKIQPYEKITCTLDCITEKLVVSGKGPLYIPAGCYDAYFSVRNLFTKGHTQDDAWTPYISDIVIENGITQLCEDNFENEGINSISIPKSVKKIEKGCFGTLADDEKSTLEVYYAGSKADWDKIKIGKYNEILTKGNIHFTENVSADNEMDENSSNTSYIVLGVSAVAVIVCAAAIVFVVKKKKNK